MPDQIFSTGIILRVCRSLPPQLGQRVEAICREQSFEALLCGLVDDPLALSLLHRSLSAAVNAVRQRPELVARVTREVYASASVGLHQLER